MNAKTRRDPFRAIDEKVFAQVDHLKRTQAYERYVDALAKFTDVQQQRINTAVSLLVMAAPLLLAGAVLWGNLGLRSELAERRDILENIESFGDGGRALDALAGRSYAIKDKNSLVSRMETLGARASIGRDDVTVLSFATTRTAGDLRESMGRMQFKNLSTRQLGDLLSLLARDRFTIATLNADKSPDGKSIQGAIGLAHFGRHEP